MRHQTISALRWISVLPAAIAWYFITNAALFALAKVWDNADLLLWVFPTVAFIMGGVMTAPRKRYVTAIALTVLYCTIELAAAVAAPQLAGSTNRVSLSIVIAIATCVWIGKGKLPKKA
jgi:uncharacterized membrane protein YoaK (UPF0700 family)